MLLNIYIITIYNFTLVYEHCVLKSMFTLQLNNSNRKQITTEIQRLKHTGEVYTQTENHYSLSN